MRPLLLLLLCTSAAASAKDRSPRARCGPSCIAVKAIADCDRAARAKLAPAAAADLARTYPHLAIVAACDTETGEWLHHQPRTALTLVDPKKSVIVRLLSDGEGHWQLLARTRHADRRTYPGLLFFGEQRCLSAADAAALATKLGCPGQNESDRCDFHSDVSSPDQAHPSVCLMTGDIGGPDYDSDWDCFGYNPKAMTEFSRWLESHTVD